MARQCVRPRAQPGRARSTRLPPGQSAGSARRARLLVVVPLVAGAAAYAGSFTGPLFFDDVFSLSQNMHLREANPLVAAWRSAFAPPHSPLTSRPVVALSFALNFACGELNVAGYHAVNLAIHLAAGLLVWGIVRRTLACWPAQGKLARAAPGVATAVALLWTVHPLATEAVVYVTQRTTLLKSFFLLATLYASLRAWNSPRRRGWERLAVGCCALGMASKETMIGAPLLVGLYDGVFLAASWRQAWQRRWPLYAGLAATWALLAVLVALGPANPTVGFDLPTVTPWHYLLTQAGAIVYYLRLAAWPDPLTVAYDWPLVQSLAEAFLPALVVAGLLAATVCGLWRRRWWGWLGAWFFILLGPTSSFLPIATELLAERRMYLALLAPITLAVAAAWRIAQLLPLDAPRARHLAAACTLVAAVAGAWASAARVADYRDEQTIWTDTIAKAPRCDLAYNNLACLYYREGRREQAIELFQHVIDEINPYYVQAHASLAVAHYDQGHYVQAERQGRTALALNPRLAGVRSNLALALAAQGRFDEALEVVREELALAPRAVESWNTLGIVHAQQRQFSIARAAFEKAIRRDRLDLRPYRNRCQTFLDEAVGRDGSIDLARLRLAIEQFRQFVAEHPRDADGRRRLAQALALGEQLADSLAQWQAYLRLRPDDASARAQAARLRNVLDQQTQRTVSRRGQPSPVDGRHLHEL